MSDHVTVVGLGRMGRAIAKRLNAQGIKITAYNRSRSHDDELIEAGMKVASTAKEAVHPGALVISTLTDEVAVREMFEGDSGLLRYMMGGVNLSVTTLSPKSALRLSDAHRNAGVTYISTPVQGRPSMAEIGQLVAWISGPTLGYREEIVLKHLTRSIINLGHDCQFASAAKLALNMLINANIELFAEAFSYANMHGVDIGLFGNGITDTVFNSPIFQAIILGLNNPSDLATGSDIAVSQKDLALFSEGVKELNLPASKSISNVFTDAVIQGLGELDPVAIRRLFTVTSSS